MKNGFTLIELLVVLVIVAMASAFVAPRFFAPMGNLQLKTAAKKIAGTMRYSRSLAVAEKDNRVCVFDFDDHQVSVFKGILPDADDDADGFSESLPEIQYDLPEKVFLKKPWPEMRCLKTENSGWCFLPTAVPPAGTLP
ncbi:MAG: prepilin-type N-terminal cleavage/methylation domain-containing protein [Desulfobacterales bacterium]